MKFPSFSAGRANISSTYPQTESSIPLEISTKTTEVLVTETFRSASPPDKIQLWSNFDDLEDQDIRPENMEFITAADADPKTSLHYASSSRELKSDPRSDSQASDYQAIDESIQALPQLPSPTFSEYNRMIMSAPTSSRKIFHSRGWSKGSRG